MSFRYPTLTIVEDKRKWVVFALLLIAALIAVLVTFELTGIPKQQPTPEVILVDTISWNMAKTQGMTINEAVESHYEDDYGIVSVNFTFSAWTYLYNWTPVSDGFFFGVYCSANTNSGFIHSVKINFSRTDSNSYVSLFMGEDHVETHNLKIAEPDSKATPTSDALVTANAINQPNATTLRIVACWYCSDKEANHRTTITLETTIFNGTAYIKTVMPVQLEVLAS